MKGIDQRMAKSKRVKSDSLLIPIPNWDEADQILRRIGQLQNDIAVSEMACAEQIDAAKLKMQQETLDKHTSVKRYVESLEAFCAAHRAAFGKKQSRQLQFGTLGFRRSTAIAIKKTTLELIKFIYGLASGDYITVKESPNKEALDKLPDEQLSVIDARREEKETFFVEPDKIESVHNNQ